MENCEGVVKVPGEDITAGGMLRHQVFNKITPILLESNSIRDSNSRLLIQACCLDVVTSLEDVIKDYNLDEHKVSAK